MNTGGSYNCHCNRGYRLHVGAGGRSCVGERHQPLANPGILGWEQLLLHAPRPTPHRTLSLFRPERVRQASPVW